MERRRYRVLGNSFNELTEEQQVQYIIDNWNKIWTPVDAEIDFSISIDDLEYFDYYYLPNIIGKIRGTKYEKYEDEIIRGLFLIFFNP